MKITKRNAGLASQLAELQQALTAKEIELQAAKAHADRVSQRSSHSRTIGKAKRRRSQPLDAKRRSGGGGSVESRRRSSTSETSPSRSTAKAGALSITATNGASAAAAGAASGGGGAGGVEMIWESANGKPSGAESAKAGASRRRRVARRGTGGSAAGTVPAGTLGMSGRYSLGGKMSSLSAASRTTGNSSSIHADSNGAAAAPSSRRASDEDASEWRSAKDVLSKPMTQHPNVFSRLSDYRSFTGMHRATHETIALGRNEYKTTEHGSTWGVLQLHVCVGACESTTDVCCFDMFVWWGADMFRRARSKKAWSHSLRSSTDDSASRKAASRSRSDPKVSAVVGRLTDVKNFTGTHKHKHEELKSKRPHTSHGVGSRGTGAAAGGAGGGPVRPRTASAASEGDAGVDEAAGGGVAWEEAEPSAPQVSPRPASATRGSPPGSGSRKTPDRSPIRISQAGSRLSAGAATHDDNSARRDCLGTARLLDVVRPECGEALPSE